MLFNMKEELFIELCISLIKNKESILSKDMHL